VVGLPPEARREGCRRDMVRREWRARAGDIST
jgi:hypothetical protein